MFEIGVLIASFIVFIYIWLAWNHNHWKKLNVPYVEPSLFFGNLKDYILMKKCLGEVYKDLYRKGTEPVLGVFKLRQPQWLIRDPGLLKMLTTTEFSNFGENDIYSEPSDFFLSTNIAFFSGEKWKKNRQIITPALTMSKLKLFIPHMVEVCREMVTYIEENREKEMQAKPFAALFTIETAMSFVYSIKCNSYKDPDSEHRKVFNEIFEPNWWNGFKFGLANLLPPVGHLFKIGLTPPRFLDIYSNIVKQTVDFKKKNNVNRVDFLQSLIDESVKNQTPELSIHDVTGLTMNVAADASETTSAGIACVMDALIRYPDRQALLRKEIDEKIKSLDDITYDNIISLTYLNAFILESFRILSPVPLLMKKCTKDCEITFEGNRYPFKKGDLFALPMYAIHSDSKHFPNPEEFRPERFLEAEEPTAFFPFGNGPRMCLGRIFASIQMKMFFCTLLSHYEVLPKNDRAPPIEFEPNSTFFLMVKGGVWFRLKKRF